MNWVVLKEIWCLIGGGGCFGGNILFKLRVWKRGCLLWGWSFMKKSERRDSTVQCVFASSLVLCQQEVWPAWVLWAVRVKDSLQLGPALLWDGGFQGVSQEASGHRPVPPSLPQQPDGGMEARLSGLPWRQRTVGSCFHFGALLDDSWTVWLDGLGHPGYIFFWGHFIYLVSSFFFCVIIRVHLLNLFKSPVISSWTSLACHLHRASSWWDHRASSWWDHRASSWWDHRASSWWDHRASSRWDHRASSWWDHGASSWWDHRASSWWDQLADACTPGSCGDKETDWYTVLYYQQNDLAVRWALVSGVSFFGGGGGGGGWGWG